MDMVVEAEEVARGGRETDRFVTFRHGRDQGGFTARVRAGLLAIGEAQIHHRSLGHRCPSRTTAKFWRIKGLSLRAN
ncbi:MAG: hypothetical protein ACXADO_00295 [Candidatus Thorarchaeota archaeon]